MKHAHYRKINDRTQNSSKYHKKDCVSVYSARAIFKIQLKRELSQIK